MNGPDHGAVELPPQLVCMFRCLDCLAQLTLQVGGSLLREGDCGDLRKGARVFASRKGTAGSIVDTVVEAEGEVRITVETTVDLDETEPMAVASTGTLEGFLVVEPDAPGAAPVTLIFTGVDLADAATGDPVTQRGQQVGRRSVLISPVLQLTDPISRRSLVALLALAAALVPEPATALLLGAGLGALATTRRRRR